MNSKYERLSQSVDEDSERGDWTPRRSKHTVEIRTLNRPLKIVLVVSNTLWLLVLSLLVFALWKSSPREPRFATDLPDAQRAVRYEQRVYSQALFYNEATKQVERHVDPDEPVYFGEPSPDVDANWDTLLHGEFPAMTSEEAEQFQPDLEPYPDGSYHMELQVTHELHCLNTIRMHLHHDYYKNSSYFASHESIPYTSPRDHLEHCLNLVLQGIFCHSDLTPVPMYTWEGVAHAIGRGAPHTCRDFKSVREWYDQRNADGSSYHTDFVGTEPAEKPGLRPFMGR